MYLEIGGTFNSGPMVKIFLDRPKDRLGTVEEYIQVGFKTKSKRGILMEMRGEGESNYIIVKVNNNGGITIEFDIGFKRYEVTTNYDVDLTNDQHHMVYAWRTDLGTKWHLKVFLIYHYIIILVIIIASSVICIQCENVITTQVDT